MAHAVKLTILDLHQREGENREGRLRELKLIRASFSKFSKFLYRLEWLLPFNYQLFQIYFLTYSLFHLNIIYSLSFIFFFIIIYSYYIHSQQLYFSNEKCYLQHFSKYFHNNYIKILCKKLLLVLIWTHRWNYFFTHQY